MPDVLEELAAELVAASRALVAVTTRALGARGTDLTLVQYRCLVILAFDGPRPTTALSVDVGVHQSTVTRATDQLVARGLTQKERDPADARRTLVRLTDAGQELVDSVMSARQEAVLEVLRRMRPADAVRATRALAAFTEQADAPRSGPQGGPID